MNYNRSIKASAKKVSENIRTLVAYKDDKVRNEIVDTIKGLGYVDVLITNPNKDRIVDIFKDYKEFTIDMSQ